MILRLIMSEKVHGKTICAETFFDLAVLDNYKFYQVDPISVAIREMRNSLIIEANKIYNERSKNGNEN